ADFTAAIHSDGENAEAFYRRGLAYWRQGQQDLAISDFRAARRLNPHVGLYPLGRALEGMTEEERERILTEATETLQRHPDNAAAYYRRGLVRFSQGDYGGAIEDLTAAIERNPRYTEAYYARGRAYLLTKEWDRAIADFTVLIGDYDDFTLPTLHVPGGAEFYYLRGFARCQKGEMEGAMADLNQALELHPGYAEAYEARGTVRQARGQEAEAQADFRMARRLEADETQH
ncbi:tetratricopeptide repeat protein, partial [Thermogemmata fonticola]